MINFVRPENYADPQFKVLIDSKQAGTAIEDDSLSPFEERWAYFRIGVPEVTLRARTLAQLEDRIADLYKAPPRKFRVMSVDGTDSDPLGCDCYGGCWGVHSETWPALGFPDAKSASQAFRLIWSEDSGLSRSGPKHGSYVLMDSSLRFCTAALRDAHAVRICTSSLNLFVMG